MTVEIITATVLNALAWQDDNSFDAVLTDPPYGLGTTQPTYDELKAYLLGDELDTGGDFMGADWSVPSIATWKAVYRVLKPGGYMLVFAGPRTDDLMALGLRAAGFEIRDKLLYMFGKGFPKSQNIGKAIDKSAGATREIVGTQVLTGNAAVALAEKGGTYGIQVGVVPPKEVPITAPATELAKQWDGYGTALKPGYETIILARKPLIGTMVENISAHGTGGLNLGACRIGDETHIINRFDDGAKPFGNGAGHEYTANVSEGRWPGHVLLDDYAAVILDEENEDKRPSRFFYTAKVNSKERNAGCESLPLRSAGEVTGDREEGSAGLGNPRAGAGRTTGAHNHHPTLKPIALNEWLAALIKPPASGKLLVPFAGAGSEMIGALRAGWTHVVGIEMDEMFVEIANLRIVHWSK